MPDMMIDLQIHSFDPIHNTIQSASRDTNLRIYREKFVTSSTDNGNAVPRVNLFPFLLRAPSCCAGCEPEHVLPRLAKRGRSRSCRHG